MRRIAGLLVLVAALTVTAGGPAGAASSAASCKGYGSFSESIVPQSGARDTVSIGEQVLVKVGVSTVRRGSCPMTNVDSSITFTFSGATKNIVKGGSVPGNGGKKVFTKSFIVTKNEVGHESGISGRVFEAAVNVSAQQGGGGASGSAGFTYRVV